MQELFLTIGYRINEFSNKDTWHARKQAADCVNEFTQSAVFYGCQGRSGHMRAQDRQFQQNLVAGVMDKPGAPGVPFDVEGSGYGFRIVRDIPASQAEIPATCVMQRPWQ